MKQVVWEGRAIQAPNRGELAAIVAYLQDNAGTE